MDVFMKPFNGYLFSITRDDPELPGILLLFPNF